MEITLNDGEMFCVDGDMRGLDVACIAGQLWVTQPGDERDHIFATGGEFTVSQKGRVVIVALGTTRLQLHAPQVSPAITRPWYSRLGSGRGAELALRWCAYSSS